MVSSSQMEGVRVPDQLPGADCQQYEWYVAGQFSKPHTAAAYQEGCYKQKGMCAWSLISQ